MKRSEINAAVRDAQHAFEAHHWHLPPNPRWDVTGFGLGNFRRFGLVLINLADLPEYCEKLMFARKDQTTVLHTHRKKQEDIICRVGMLAIRLVASGADGRPDRSSQKSMRVLVNGEPREVLSGSTVTMGSGERITLYPGIYHEFWPVSDTCIIGEVSTANDDLHDNVFENPEVGRFEELIEDEPPLVRLVSDPPAGP